mmetsp:Transcript_25439/g.74917  ORF Transcript_25439/g.74917 Transcript_25439/m.74917 type:complete len:141 (-) Transcript_25439:3286-3708(-)
MGYFATQGTMVTRERKMQLAPFFAGLRKLCPSRCSRQKIDEVRECISLTGCTFIQALLIDSQGLYLSIVCSLEICDILGVCIFVTFEVVGMGRSAMVNFLNQTLQAAEAKSAGDCPARLDNQLSYLVHSMLQVSHPSDDV